MAKRKRTTRTGNGSSSASRGGSGSRRKPAGRAREVKAKTARGRGAGAATRAAKQGRSAASSRAKTPARAASARPKASGRKPAAGKSTSRRTTPAKGSAARERSAGRQRKALRDLEDVTGDIERRWDAEEEDVPTPPSTLDLDRHASAARTGRSELQERRRKHTAASPAVTGGDVDADWEGAYFVGDESATGDNPTPDQSRVEDIGRAVGVDYEDTEELKSTPKIDRRDKKRWELDPASSEDYKERNRRRGR